MKKVFGRGFIITVSVHGFQMHKWLQWFFHVSSCSFGLGQLLSCTKGTFSFVCDFIQDFVVFFYSSLKALNKTKTNQRLKLIFLMKLLVNFQHIK